jgi:hypothetical protein
MRPCMIALVTFPLDNFSNQNSMKLSMVMHTLTESCWIEFKVQNLTRGPRISYYKCHIYYVFLLSPSRLLFGLMPLLVCCHRQCSGNPAQKLIFWHVSLMIMQLVRINLSQGPTKKTWLFFSSYAASCPLLNSPNRIIPAQVDDCTTIYK